MNDSMHGDDDDDGVLTKEKCVSLPEEILHLSDSLQKPQLKAERMGQKVIDLFVQFCLLDFSLLAFQFLEIFCRGWQHCNRRQLTCSC